MSDALLRLGAGARAVEELLLEDLDELAPAGADELRHGPVRIVVPSRALRRHLAARLAERKGAVLGVSTHTLRGLATAVLEAADAALRPGSALLVPLARRVAAREPALGNVLRFEGGPRAVAGAVRDLLDAGLDAVNAEAALERLGEHAAGRPRERAEALVRVAVGVQAEFDRLEVASPAAALRAAADALAGGFDELLPSRAVLVHGFADATGAASELLQALLRHDDARLYLDRPADPAQPERADSGNAFALRFAERVLPGASARTPVRSSPPALPELLRAPGGRAEAAAIAQRLASWIDAGGPPERMAVLLRHPLRQLPAFRAELARAGVPFSCGRAMGPPGALSRRAEALRRLLRGGERAGLECWLDSVASLTPEERSDLASALRVLGAPRLRDLVALEGRLATLADGSGRIRLALRRGLEAGGGDGEDDESGRAHAPRRTVRAAVVERELARARRGLEALGARPARADGGAQVAAFRVLLEEALDWSAERPADRPLLAALDRLAGELSVDLELDRDDADALLDELLAGLGRHEAGGAGGGVQLLSVMEARALTFDRLVLPSLNRDAFPRIVREDALLPDLLRRLLHGGGAGVLPDLAEKSAGVDEERFLFAQALSAAPSVLLSWCASDEEGKAKPASPLLERVILERLRDESTGAPVEVPLAPHRRSAPPEGAALERPALDHAVLAALHGAGRAVAPFLPAALAEAALTIGSKRDAAATAAARARLLEEFDAAPGSAAARRLGPFFGFVGPITGRADPRREGLAVTRVEGVVRCGWRAFVSRVLGVEPAPDPLGALPALSRQVLGQVVHDVLEWAVAERLGPDRPGTLEAALEVPAVRVVLPPAAELRELFERSVDRRAAEAGLPLGAFAAVVVERAMELFEVARAADWGEGSVDVVGVELEGSAAVALPGGGERRVAFRTDRVDRVEGRPRLVDYKTGKPPGDQVGGGARRKAHLAKMSEGSFLQPSAYVLGAGESAEGRLLFLGESVPDHARSFSVDGSEADFAARFAAIVAAVDPAWTLGTFLPRLADAKGVEPPTCRWCEVREACLRGDSGARRRLSDWSEAAEEARSRGRAPKTAEERAALDLQWVAARAEEAEP